MREIKPGKFYPIKREKNQHTREGDSERCPVMEHKLREIERCAVLSRDEIMTFDKWFLEGIEVRVAPRIEYTHL